MPRIIVAGLLDELAKSLEKSLPGVTVEVAHSGKEVLALLPQGNWDLMLIDGSLQDPTAPEVLSQARSQPHLVDLPVVYCLDKSGEDDANSKLLRELGVANGSIILWTGNS